MSQPVMTTFKPVAPRLGAAAWPAMNWAAIASTAWVSAAAASPVALLRRRGQRPEDGEHQLGLLLVERVPGQAPGAARNPKLRTRTRTRTNIRATGIRSAPSNGTC
jgi:hypothetical protein